jgi:hypothetical protein
MMMIIILIVIFNFYARPVDHGSWWPTHFPQVRSHDPSTTCPQPKGKTKAPRVRWGVSTQRQELKHHVCAGEYQPKSRARAPLVRWECQTQMQEPQHHMDAGVVLNPQAEAKRHVSPRGFSLIIITIY